MAQPESPADAAARLRHEWRQAKAAGASPDEVRGIEVLGRAVAVVDEHLGGGPR